MSFNNLHNDLKDTRLMGMEE